MAGENPELGIEITGNSSGATQAVNQTTASVQQLGRAADAAGQQVERAGSHGSSAFGKLVQGGRAAHGAMMGLNTSMQGGAATAVGLSRALNDVFILMSTAGAAAGPIALVALGIGVLLGVMRGLTGHAGHAKDRLDALAHSATALGKAFATKELEMFNRELKETDRQIDLVANKFKALIAIREKLAEEATKQSVLSIQLAQAEKDKKLAVDVQAIQDDRALPPEIKSERIAALRRANEDDKARNAARIKGVEFSGTETAAGLRIKEIDSQKAENSRKALAEQIHADEIAATAAFRSSQLTGATGDAAQLGTASDLRDKIANLRQAALLAGSKDTPNAGDRAQAYLDQIPKLQTQLDAITAKGLPSQDQLVSKIGQLIEELAELNKKFEAANNKARDAGRDAADKNEVLDVERGGVGTILGAKGRTAALGVAKDRVDFDTSKIGELSKLMGDVRDNQEKLFGLTGDAFNAQQIILNKSVDIYQGVVRQSKVTDSQLSKIEQQMRNARSTSGNGN